MKDITEPYHFSYRTYVYVWVALLIFLGLTIANAEMSLTAQYSVSVTLFIASIKGALVLYYFMHLKEECWIVKAMLLLAIGTLTVTILLTFSDTWYR